MTGKKKIPARVFGDERHILEAVLSMISHLLSTGEREPVSLRIFVERVFSTREERRGKKNLPILLLRTRACQRARGRGDVAREIVLSVARETVAEGERRKRREKERERESERERERMKRERMKNDVDKTWLPGGGRNYKTVHVSGNADVVPQSGHRKRWPQSRPKMKGRATIRCLPNN